MEDQNEVYCPTCFATAGEKCRSKYVVRENEDVVPVICETHQARMLERQKSALDHSFAVRILAAALIAYRGN